MRFSAQVIVTLLLFSLAVGFLGGISKNGQSVVSGDEQAEGQEGGLEVLSEEATVYGSGSGLWSLTDGPAIQSGWSALTWQPDPKGPSGNSTSVLMVSGWQRLTLLIIGSMSGISAMAGFCFGLATARL